MLKQFSLPQKIFGTTTLLFGMCYAGFLIYVQPAFAADPIWLWYNAQVWNIHRVSGDTWRNNTRHRVRYDNTANADDMEVEIRAKAVWVRKHGPHTLIFDNDNWDTHETCLAGAAGTIFINKHVDQHITLEGTWKAQAYTNLVDIDDWHDGGRWKKAVGIDTEQISREDFPPIHPVISNTVENLDQP